jgi:hypothetical protein
MPDWLAAAIASAIASGLINYGSNKVQFMWLRRDIDAAHDRLDNIGAPSTGYGSSRSPNRAK